MSPPNDSSNNASAVRLLKIAALVFAGFGGSLSAWGVDKWINQPQARASQFGFEAPLWPAFTLFVLFATVVIVGLFWTAAERVADGENLFAQRHRRRSSSSEDSSNGRPRSE
jgi:hypothetical protein